MKPMKKQTCAKKEWAVTTHAVDRWVERVPNAKRQNAAVKLAEWANNGRIIDSKRIQFGKYILKIEGFTIYTIHKITAKYVMRKIYNSKHTNKPTNLKP